VTNQIHLDIKPENILLNSKGEIKISDFGISRNFENSFDMLETYIGGTFLYMSPERLFKKKYNNLSDIWSLGLVLLELALNEYPFKKQTNIIEQYTFL
jgi:mitogen-activated protein kinase kinase 3